jgi:hypothetical protein
MSVVVDMPNVLCDAAEDIVECLTVDVMVRA